MSIIGEIVEVCKQVASFQLEHFRNFSELEVSMKAQKETVSFVDVESEKILSTRLSQILPAAGFYGEESGKSGNQELVWIVDPLDGTTNYLSGLDHFSISVALVKHGVPEVGVVFKPYSGEWIAAERGNGIIFNGENYSNRFNNTKTEESLYSTGFPYRSADLNDAFFDCVNNVLRLGRGVRRSGSAALDLAYLGLGWFGGFWESDLMPYDVAGAMCIMAEAGVKVTNHKGEAYDMFSDRICVAAQENVHAELLKVVSSSYQDYLK